MEVSKGQIVQELKPHDHPMRFRFPNGLKIAWSKMSIFTEKSSFQMKPISTSEAMSINKIVPSEAQKIQTSSLRSRCNHKEWLFGADFGTVASLGHSFSKMSKESPLWSMASVTVPCSTDFCFQKLKRMIWTTFGFNTPRKQFLWIKETFLWHAVKEKISLNWRMFVDSKKKFFYVNKSISLD